MSYHVLVTLPVKKESLVSIKEETGWDQQAVWTLWRSEKYRTCAGNRDTGSQSSILVTVSTTLTH